jgi:hypothetical protein
MEWVRQIIAVLASVTGLLAAVTALVFAAVPDGRQRATLFWLMAGIAAQSLLKAVAIWAGMTGAAWTLVNLAAGALMFASVGNLVWYLVLGQYKRGR